MLRHVSHQTLNRNVEIEKYRAFTIVAHHALDPEERSEPRTTRHRTNVMKTGSRIKNQMTRRQFHRMHAVSIFDDELAAVVFVGIAEEQRRGKISANSMRRAASPDGSRCPRDFRTIVRFDNG